MSNLNRTGAGKMTHRTDVPMPEELFDALGALATTDGSDS